MIEISVDNKVQKVKNLKRRKLNTLLIIYFRLYKLIIFKDELHKRLGPGEPTINLYIRKLRQKEPSETS